MYKTNTSKGEYMKHCILMIALLCSSVVPASAVLYDGITDTFSGSALNTTLWEETLYSERAADNTTSLVSDGMYSVRTTINATGNNEYGYLKTNYYFFGDFDTQMSVNQHRDGHEWKVILGINFDGQSSQFQSNIPEEQWYDIRIQRVGPDVTTYYKQTSSSTWLIQDTYVDHGTTPLEITYHCGDTSAATLTRTYYDTYTAQGYAETDITAATHYSYLYYAGVSAEFEAEWDLADLVSLRDFYLASKSGTAPESIIIDDKTWNFIADNPAGRSAGDYWADGDGTQSVYFGDGTLTSFAEPEVVPEPATVVLLGVSAALNLVRRVRSRRS